MKKFLNKIINADCFDIIGKIKYNSVDLIICDGPYGITEFKWDRVKSIQKFNLKLIRKFTKILKPGGTAYIFGKFDCVDFIDYTKYLKLITKIVWYQPARLAQGKLKYTNNYDIISYFVKPGKQQTFNLDEIRVAQMVELEHRKRCENVPSVKGGKYGKTVFNKKGKNPGDVWGDIKQLTYKSKELISRDVLNTIQKPEKLIERMIKASSNKGDLVLDPFSGTGTTACVSKRLNRNFIAVEKDKSLFSRSIERLQKGKTENDKKSKEDVKSFKRGTKDSKK
jgi:DNA modification methylase